MMWGGYKMLKRRGLESGDHENLDTKHFIFLFDFDHKLRTEPLFSNRHFVIHSMCVGCLDSLHDHRQRSERFDRCWRIRDWMSKSSWPSQEHTDRPHEPWEQGSQGKLLGHIGEPFCRRWKREKADGVGSTVFLFWFSLVNGTRLRIRVKGVWQLMKIQWHLRHHTCLSLHDYCEWLARGNSGTSTKLCNFQCSHIDDSNPVFLPSKRL